MKKKTQCIEYLKTEKLHKIRKMFTVFSCVKLFKYLKD